MYTFDQYSADIEATRKGVHNTSVYACLGLIGELGELVDLILDMLPTSNTSIEDDVLEELNKFVFLAGRIEYLKKSVRGNQIACFPAIKTVDDDAALVEELGGVLWYLDTLTTNLRLTLTNVAFSNQLMLKHRFLTNPNWMLKGIKTH